MQKNFNQILDHKNSIFVYILNISTYQKYSIYISYIGIIKYLHHGIFEGELTDKEDYPCANYMYLNISYYDLGLKSMTVRTIFILVIYKQDILNLICNTLYIYLVLMETIMMEIHKMGIIMDLVLISGTLCIYIYIYIYIGRMEANMKENL